MKRWHEIAASILVAAALVTSSVACDANSAQRDFSEAAFQEEPDGYTRTSSRGRIDSSHIDDDDWRIAPDYQFGGSVEPPPYPNPTSSSEVTVSVQMGIDNQAGSYLTLCTYDVGNDRLILLDSYPASRLDFTFFVSPTRIPETGLTRLFVLDTNGSTCQNGRVVTYGDVLFR